MKRLLVLLVVAWLAGPPASHAQSPEAAKALADLVVDDADKREAAIAVIGGTRDPKWLEFLAALRDGNVYARGKGKDAEVVVGGAKTTKGDAEVIEIASAYERKPLGAVPLAGLVEIAADRRLRIAIKPFLDADETRVQLASPDPEARRGAAMKLGHQAAAGAAPVVEAAIKKEAVPARAPRAGGGAGAHPAGPRRCRRPHSGRADRSGRCTRPTPCPRCRSSRPIPAASPAERDAARRRHPPDRALGPPGPDGRDRVPGRLARVDPAADVAGTGHRVRPDGRHQHGPRRADGARRLQHVRRAERLPRALARSTSTPTSWSRCPCRSWWRRWSASCWSAASSAGCTAGRWRRCCSRGAPRSSSSRGCASGSAPPTWTSPRRRWLSGGFALMTGLTLPFNRLFIIGLAAVSVAGHVLAALPHRHRPAHPCGDSEPQR